MKKKKKHEEILMYVDVFSMYFVEMNRIRLNTTAILSTTAFAISLVRLARLITTDLIFSNFSSLLEDASSNGKVNSFSFCCISMIDSDISIIFNHYFISKLYRFFFCLFYLYKQYKKRRKTKYTNNPLPSQKNNYTASNLMDKRTPHVIMRRSTRQREKNTEVSKTHRCLQRSEDFDEKTVIHTFIYRSE